MCERVQYRGTKYTKTKEEEEERTWGELTRNSEHVTGVKRHVSVAVGARTAALRVPVLPQGHRQQVPHQGRPQVVKVIFKVQGCQRCCYLVLLHLTVEGKPVGEIFSPLVTTGGQQPNTINDTQSTKCMFNPNTPWP